MKKTIYPDYDIIEKGFDREGYGIEFLTQIRKQRKDGKWFLIPVREQYWLNENNVVCWQSALKGFIDTCYRVLIFYKISEDGKSPVLFTTPWIHCEEKDSDQRSERFRLNHYLNFNIKVL